MIRLHRSVSVAAATALLLSATVAGAEATRPGSSVPMVSKAVTEKMGTRTSKRVKSEERLTGVPLALLIVAVVGSIAAVAALSKKSDSRG